ncbi:MAG: flagellar hook assembly protein FlgD [Bacilli bacterium]
MRVQQTDKQPSISPNNKTDSSLLSGLQGGTGSSSLGKDEFLKILVTQLQNQDPMSPMDDKDFIAQMAQFSSLEQMMNLNALMGDFVWSQYEQNMVLYSNLIGQEVKFEYLNEDKEVVKGTQKVVSVIKESDGTILIKLENGDTIYPNEIVAVNPQEDEVEKPEPEPEPEIPEK